MNLHMLTTSGWLWLGATIAMTFATLAASIRGGKRNDADDVAAMAIIAGLMLAWLLWLVTP